MQEKLLVGQSVYGLSALNSNLRPTVSGIRVPTHSVKDVLLIVVSPLSWVSLMFGSNVSDSC